MTTKDPYAARRWFLLRGAQLRRENALALIADQHRRGVAPVRTQSPSRPDGGPTAEVRDF